jgi:hypothetical protein
MGSSGSEKTGGLAVLMAVTTAAILLTASASSAEENLQRRRPGHAAPATAPQATLPAPTIQSQPPSVVPQPEPSDPEATSVSAKPRRRAHPLAAPGFIAIPDRWRIIENLGVIDRWYDPYNQNTLKGDRPIYGDDWFLELGVVWDSLVEARSFPVGKGIQGTDNEGDLDIFGTGDFLIFNQNLIMETVFYKGDTTFRPPDYEFRLALVANHNYVDAGERTILHIDPDDGTTREDGHLAVQEMLVDIHLGNKSHYYDFDSLRLGIQEFNADFRGFLYEDSQPGIRLFGNFNENRYQYNVAWFHRLEKDTNSGLNTVFEERADDILVINAFRQDTFVKGLTAEAVVLYNRNREGDRKAFYDDNGFIQRPVSIGDERRHNYDVVYFGLGADGRIGRINLTTNSYLALGNDTHNPIAQRSTDIQAYLLAAEASIDFDWTRLKLFGLFASGDDDPFDGKAKGFDAVAENPNFAGGDSSYWQRQTIPLAAGGDVFLSGRNGLLANLRPSKEHGQSNFVNPGLNLFGVGADFDLLPELRLSTHVSYLEFADTAVLRTTRQQRAVDPEIGYDISATLLWRPLFIENVVFRLSGAALIPGAGFDDLYDEKYDAVYSVITNMLLTY